jgi:large subunit ribosomal protein L1
MVAVAKRMKPWAEKIPVGKQFAIDEALALVKQFATAKFDETIDVAVNLGIDASKSDQQVRGSTVLPNGTGKKVRVAVFTSGKNAMRVVGQLGQILGPRGLMPNPKVGTVTPDVAGAVRNAKAGQVRFRADKAGVVHCSLGKSSFEVKALKENLNALLADLHKAKPAASKGIYMKRVTVSSTMGPGVAVDQASLAA